MVFVVDAGRALARAAGRAVCTVLAYVGETVLLVRQVLGHVLRGEVTRGEAFEQMCRIGVAGLPLVVVTCGFSGLVFGVYTVAQFQRFGARELIGAVIGMSMSREVAPVLAATVVAARSGSAIAAEVATMKVTEQLDALRALATDPVEYLAVPRYVALVIMLPMLTLVGMFSGTFGALVFAVAQGVTFDQFYKSLVKNVPLDFVWTGCLKGVVFGALIAIASIRQGLRCGYGAEAVGRTTTQAVVLDIIWIHTANLVLAMLTT